MRIHIYRCVSSTTWSANAHRAALRTQYDQTLYTPEEKKLRDKATSNKPYHYLGVPKIIYAIGKGFAEALIN